LKLQQHKQGEISWSPMRHKFGLCLGLLGIFSLAVQHFLVIPLMHQVFMYLADVLTSGFPSLVVTALTAHHFQQGKPQTISNSLQISTFAQPSVLGNMLSDPLSKAINIGKEMDNTSVLAQAPGLEGCDAYLLEQNSDLKVGYSADIV
jgi:hypothetical protein